MSNQDDYPDFSNIRSHLQRTEARRNLKIGYALADAPRRAQVREA